MKKISLLVGILFTLSMMSGCIATKTDHQQFIVKTETERTLYGLMQSRCQALSSANTDELIALYTKDSNDPDWLAETVLPVISEWPAKYRISTVENMTIVGKDAAATYKILFYNDYKEDRQLVDVLYEMEDGKWKIDSVNAR